MTTPGELTLLYVAGAQIGYGRLGVYLAEELARRGYTVYDDDGNPEPSRTARRQLLEGGRSRSAQPTNLACWVSVPSHMMGFFKEQHKAFITMWEAMTLPESFRETFHQIDTMIVPSMQNVELFSRYHKNVKYMPLGVDPKLWHYIPPSPPTREFNFLISGRGTRKGVDLAFKAFRAVFKNLPTTGSLKPVPRLIMKSLKGHGEYFSAGVEHVTGRLDAIPERDLYASAHCYLQPSRGEGFGLQPLQAMALGRPTILTDAHGHASFAKLGIPLPWAPSVSDYFIYGDAGEWWEPDFEALCEAMWDVYNNYDTHAERARLSAETISQEWTWSNVTDRFIEIMGDEMGRPQIENAEWTLTDRAMFPIVTTKDFCTDIAGRTLMFRAGETYWESADVKRILFDGGILDNACLGEDENGLAPIQVEQLGKYRAAHEWCTQCGQQMGTRPTHADAVMAELEAEFT